MVDYYEDDIWSHEIWQQHKVAESLKIDFELREKPVIKGRYICRECKCDRAYTTSYQCRAGDEATDVFAQCQDCGNIWKVT